MAAHIHAALMAEYAKDALETDMPWKRWEFLDMEGNWQTFYSNHPSWDFSRQYRRKRIPLCQIEGRDVFPGDKLWWIVEERWITAVRHAPDTTRGMVVWDNETWYSLHNLTWTEPPKTETVYQWAFEQPDGRFCATSYFYATEAEARVKGVAADHRKVLRLDWTALTVPTHPLDTPTS